MRSAIDQFHVNISRAKDLAGLAATLASQTTPALDATDLLRSALVMAVSALDHLVHELARLGMLDVAMGRRPPTDSYYRFAVSLRNVAVIMASPQNIDWLDTEIRERHGWMSFQDPDKISEVLRNISAKKIWPEVGNRLSLPPGDVKKRLKLIVDRRNKVAHEADLDPTAPGARWPIDPPLVADALVFLDHLALALFDVVSTP